MAWDSVGVLLGGKVAFGLILFALTAASLDGAYFGMAVNGATGKPKIRWYLEERLLQDMGSCMALEAVALAELYLLAYAQHNPN